MVKEKVIVIKCWKNLHNALERLWKLKKQYIFHVKSRLEDAFTAAKTYGNLINHLLCKKKIPAIPSLLVDGNFDSDFNKKPNFLIISLHQYVHL